MPNSTGVQRLGLQQTIENNNRTVDSGAQDLGGDRGAQQLASNYFVQAGDSKKAVSYGDRAVTLAREQNAAPTEAADALRTRALAYAAGRDYAKAHDDAVEALKLDPDNETAQAIEKLTREKNIPEQIAVKIEPGAPPAPEIAAILEKERAASPVNRPEGFSTTVGEMKQADATAQLGDYEAMYAKATEALKRLPDNPRAYMQRAFAGLMLERYDGAIDDATAGLKLKPNAGSLLGVRATAYNETGKPQLALADAQKAIDVNPKDPVGWLQKGLAREKLGEPDDQYLADIKNAAELDPSFEHFYTEALARRGQGSPAPAAPAGFSWEQMLSGRLSLVLVAAVGGLAVLFLAVLFAKRETELGRPAGKLVEIAPVPGDAPSTLAPTSVVAGRYEIARKLDKGGMGEVFEARDLKLDRSVALKRMNRELKADPKQRDRFLNEARLMAGLTHPNIVAIHDVIEDGGEFFLVMELVRGETLHDLVKSEGKLPPAKCLEIVTPVCEALDYAHGRGVIHRDIKANNLMIAAGRVMLMDFGIARMTMNSEGRTLTSLIIGTPGHMPPEQAFGEVSRESDLYALGATVYFLLNGKLAFGGDAESIGRQLDGRFDHLATGKKALDEFFARAFAPDRAKRFHSGAEFLDALKAALA